MKNHNGTKVLVPVLLIVALALVYFLTPLPSLLTEKTIRSFIEPFGVFAPIVFGIIYFVAVLFFLPASVFSVLAGLIFGKLWGTVIVVISATLAGTAAFGIARHFGKETAQKLCGKGRLGGWVKKIDDYVKAHGFQSFFIIRCLFLPYMPVSYAAGMVPAAKLRDFVLGTFVTNIIFSFMFVYLGDNLLKGPKALILPLVLVVLALQIPKVLKRFKK
jgi:uncharacterized membrane protein YdjX (TVP38/TMEM64 family)